MTNLFFLMAVVLSPLARQEGNQAPESNDWIYMGCVWGPSECYYSCPQHGGYRAEVDPELCFDPIAEWACYCDASSFEE